MLHKIGKPHDETWGDIEGGHPAEVGHPRLGGNFPILDVDFFEGFDVLADETDRHDHQILHPVGAQLVQGIVGVGPQPFNRTDPALVGQGEGIGVAQLGLEALDDQACAGFDFGLVRIARLFHVALRHPMGAEKDMGRARDLTGLDFLGNQFGHGADIAGVVVVTADAADRQALEGGIPLAQALQFPEAGAAGAD